MYPLKNNPMASWHEVNKIDFGLFSRKNVTTEVFQWLLRITALVLTVLLLFHAKVKKLILMLRKRKIDRQKTKL